MRSRKVCVAGVSAIAGLLVAACGGNGDYTPNAASGGTGTGNITVWAHQGQEGEVAALQKAVKTFNASQPDVKVKLQLIPDADYTKTITVTRPEDLPDVLEFDGPLLSAFVYSQKLSTVQGFVSERTLANQTDSVKAQNTYPLDKKLYGLSMFDSGLGIYGNKKLLDAAGVRYPTGLGDAWTVDEFEAALKALAAKDPDGKVLDLKENYGGAWPAYGYLPLLESTGHHVIVNGRAEGNLTSAPIESAVKRIAGWRRYVDPNADDGAFTGGRVALSLVGHWLYGAYSEALGNNLVVLPLPDFGAGPKSGQGSWAWGIGAHSKNAKAAGKFLDFLMNDANVAAMTTANSAPPATRSVVASSPLYKAGGPLELFSQQLAETCGTGEPTRRCVAIPRPVAAGFPVISEQFSKAFLDVYKGANADKALERAAHIIDLEYEDNNGYGQGAR